MKHIWDAGLTSEEYYSIGTIVAQWGALEAEIFGQTLMSFGSDMHVSQLPREMNNLKFISVLELWKKRVVDVANAKDKLVLQKVYDKTLKFIEFRNAIVHGMWEFSLDEPKSITTVRVKKDRLIHTVFDDGSLADFATEIAQLNMEVRYPGGVAQFFQEQMREGYYVNEAELRRRKLDLSKK